MDLPRISSPPKLAPQIIIIYRRSSLLGMRVRTGPTRMLRSGAKEERMGVYHKEKCKLSTMKIQRIRSRNVFSLFSVN